MIGRMEIDQLLQSLVKRSRLHGIAVPLTLYTPLGKISGHTTGGEDFYHLGAQQLSELFGLGQNFAFAGNLPDEDDYVHLANAKCWTTDVAEHTVLRIRLSDVIAWTVGLSE
jgi:hypothetical protein